MTSKRPRTGGRVVLERLEEAAERARYRVTLYLPDAEHVAEASIARGERSTEWTAWSPGDPPAWLVAFAQAFLDGVRRDVDRQPAGVTARWPQRLAYWRPAR